MVVALVLAMFVVFVMADYYFQRRQPQPAAIKIQPAQPEKFPCR